MFCLICQGLQQISVAIEEGRHGYMMIFLIILNRLLKISENVPMCVQ
jgi:hypothetical protein